MSELTRISGVISCNKIFVRPKSLNILIRFCGDCVGQRFMAMRLSLFFFSIYLGNDATTEHRRRSNVFIRSKGIHIHLEQIELNNPDV